MKQEWYSLNKAAELLGTDLEGIKHFIQTDQLRVGVMARRWYGAWMPEGKQRMEIADRNIKNGVETRFYLCRVDVNLIYLDF